MTGPCKCKNFRKDWEERRPCAELSTTIVRSRSPFVFLGVQACSSEREATPSVRHDGPGIPQEKIIQRRHCECGLRRQSWRQAWRVDAHADENGVGVGGWWPQANEQGVVTKWGSPWFAVKVTPDNAPWAFQREGKAYRVIATLEALGLLLALMAFGPGQKLSNTSLTVQVSAFTDNRGNGYVINKLMTTKFPLCTVIMELAAKAEKARSAHGSRVDPEGPKPRSRRPTSGFDSDKEVKLNLREQDWLVLPSLLEAGQKFHEQKALESEQRKEEERRGGRVKRKKEDKLKNREKW